MEQKAAMAIDEANRLVAQSDQWRNEEITARERAERERDDAVAELAKVTAVLNECNPDQAWPRNDSSMRGVAGAGGGGGGGQDCRDGSAHDGLLGNVTVRDPIDNSQGVNGSRRTNDAEDTGCSACAVQ